MTQTLITDARVISAITLSLPATVRATAFGPQPIPAAKIELHATGRDDREATSNAAQLLEVLYRYNVTSPEQLVLALRSVGHQEVLGAAAHPVPHIPTPSETTVRVDDLNCAHAR